MFKGFKYISRLHFIMMTVRKRIDAMTPPHFRLLSG